MMPYSSAPLTRRERDCLETAYPTTTLAGLPVPLQAMLRVLQRTPRGRQVIRRELYARRWADTGRKVR